MNDVQLGGGRIPGLDGVRGLAILLVVLSHAGLGLLRSGALVGVTLFFVLSGFLITRLLLKEQTEHGTIRVAAFYGRRAFRLLPALFVYLIGIALIVWWRRLDLPIWDMSWPPALYVANYTQILGGDLQAHTHTWSLAVEEHFYLVWPLLIGLGAARRAKPLLIAIVILLCWRFAVGQFDQGWAYNGSDTNAYALGLGCLLARVHTPEIARRYGRGALATGFIGLLGLSLIPIEGSELLNTSAVWLPPLAALLAVPLIIGVSGDQTTIMNSSALRWLGTISYSLYLWHLPLMRLPGLGETPIRRLIALSIAIGIAAISWVLIERPVLSGNWRARLSTRSRDEALPSPVVG